MARELEARYSERLIEDYSRMGLQSEVKRMLGQFAKAERQYRGVKIAPAPNYTALSIGNGQINVYLNADPKRDHCVWVFTKDLYEKVFQIGNDLGFEVRRGSSPRFAKIVSFNGVQGIRQVSGIVTELLSKLVRAFDDKSRQARSDG